MLKRRKTGENSASFLALEEAHSVQLLYMDYMQIIFSLRASFVSLRASFVSLRASFVSLRVHVFYVLDNRWTFNYFAQLSFILAQA
jgi:hypothetical protein